MLEPRGRGKQSHNLIPSPPFANIYASKICFGFHGSYSRKIITARRYLALIEFALTQFVLCYDRNVIVSLKQTFILIRMELHFRLSLVNVKRI